MNKFVRKLCIGTVTLGLLAPVATQSISNNPQITVNAKRRHHLSRRWHKGVPKSIRSNSYWYSKQSFRNGHSRAIPYYKNVIWFQREQLEMATKNYYRSKKAVRRMGVKHGHWLMSNGLGEWWNPHYKYVGHHTYKLHSGEKGSNGNSYIVKVHNHTHVSVWSDGQYMGYFHKGSHF